MVLEGYIEKIDNFNQNENIQFADGAQEVKDQLVEPFIQTKPVVTESFPEEPSPVQPAPVQDSFVTDIYERRHNAMTPAITNISQKEYEGIPIVVADAPDTMIKPEKYLAPLPISGFARRLRPRQLPRVTARRLRPWQPLPQAVPPTKTKTQIESEISVVASQALTEQNIEATPQNVSAAEITVKQAWTEQQQEEITKLRSEAELAAQVTPEEKSVFFNMTLDTLKEQGILPTPDNIQTALSTTAEEVARTKVDLVKSLIDQANVKEQEIAILKEIGKPSQLAPALVGAGLVSLLIYALIA